MKISELIGETLAYVDAGDNSILLTTTSGRVIQICHEQDCCEYVRVVGTDGNWHDLVGKVIVDAHRCVSGDVDDEHAINDSNTATTLTFKVDGATVVSRWVGSSNGYYSESVDIEDITRQYKGKLPGTGHAQQD